MRASFLNGLEKLLVVVLAATFALPLALTGWLHVWKHSFRSATWLRNTTLGGMQIAPEEVPRSAETVFSARYQSALAKNFDFHFTGREGLIRLMDEIDLRVFRSAPVGLLVDGGWPPCIIETAYAEEYCLRRDNREALRPLVDDLRRMQDYCAARGVAFAVVLTPSKAALYPENLPAAWLRRYRRSPRAYAQFIPLLQEKNVRFVDGHRITLDLKKDAPVPVFPLGGIHWSDPPALATTNAVLELLAAQGLDASPLRDYTTEISDIPEGQDADMMRLINVISRWRYPVAKITVAPTTPPRAHRPNLVWVGGSFVWKMLYMMDASRQFSEMDYYNYYTEAKFVLVDGQQTTIGRPSPAVNFDTDIFAADAVVVEVNEQNVGAARHLKDFLRDALAAAPDPHAPRVPFHYERAVPPR